MIGPCHTSTTTCKDDAVAFQRRRARKRRGAVMMNTVVLVTAAAAGAALACPVVATTTGFVVPLRRTLHPPNHSPQQRHSAPPPQLHVRLEGRRIMACPSSQHRRSTTGLWLASRQNEDDDDDETTNRSNSQNTNRSFEEFLEHRRKLQEEKALPREKKRMRDKLYQWLVGGGSTTGTSTDSGLDASSAPSSQRMVTPLHFQDQDGTTDDDDDDDVDMDDDDGDVDMEPQNKRFRPKFDTIFDGMPSIDEILDNDPTTAPSKSRTDDPKTSSLNRPGSTTTGKERKDTDSSAVMDTTTTTNNDDAFMEESIEAIDDRLNQLKQTVESRMEALQAADPDSVPDGAGSVLAQILQELKEGEVQELRDRQVQMGLEQIQAYEAKLNELMLQQQQKDQQQQQQEESSNANNNMMDAKSRLPDREQQILKTVMEETRKRKEREQEMTQFQAYQAQKQTELEQTKDDDLLARQNGERMSHPEDADDDDEEEDLDEKTLRFLERLQSKSDSESSSNAILETLEDSIEELRESIELKRARDDSVSPQTMKEWQMFRSISSMMKEEDKNARRDENEDGVSPNPMSDTNEKSNSESSQSKIAAKMQSWREFQEKEIQMREKAGLSVKHKMTFPWMEKLMEEKKRESKASSSTGAEAGVAADNRSVDEAKADLNKKTLEVMERLSQRSTAGGKDGTRLTRGIEELKSTMKLQAEAAELKKANPTTKDSSTTTTTSSPTKHTLVKTLDMKDIYGRRPVVPEATDTVVAEPVVPTPEKVPKTPVESIQSPPPPPPLEPVRRSKDNDTKDQKAPPPPNTPFFSLDDEDGDKAKKRMKAGENEPAPSLGTLEEQKFRAMSRRAGVRTASGQKKLKEGYEDFQAYERKMREQTGLSPGNDGDNAEPSSVNLKYNISEVFKEGGDIDAAKILSTIGSRANIKSRKGNTKPTTTSDPTPLGTTLSSANVDSTVKKSADPAVKDDLSRKIQADGRENKDPAFQEFLQQEENRIKKMQSETSGSATKKEPKVEEKDDSIIVVHDHEGKKLKPETVSDQLYRAVSASSGGGRARDGVNAMSKYKGAYKEYLQKEAEMRAKLAEMDGLDTDMDVDSSKIVGSKKVDKEQDVVGKGYAERILSELGPRPTTEKRKLESDFTKDYGGRGESVETVQKRDTEQIEKSEAPSIDEFMPEWLRMEREEGGSDGSPSSDTEHNRVGQSNEDGMTDEDYEENERQADEFERKITKRKGVSISDALGRNYFGAGDDDFESKTMGRRGKFSSFEARKKDLLQYTQLTVTDLNSLMEHKSGDDVTQTGINPLLVKANNPFGDFGAVFRLEGLLVDVTGLHYEAWKKTAEIHGYKSPRLDDVHLASVSRADVAVRRFFYWTDDFFRCREIAATFRGALKEVFEEWMEKNKVTVPTVDRTYPSSSSEDANKPRITIRAPDVVESKVRPVTNAPTIDKGAMTKKQLEAWTSVAMAGGYRVPGLEEVLLTSILSEDDTVRAFRWTSDYTTAKEIASMYLAKLKGTPHKETVDVIPVPGQQLEDKSGPSKKKLLEMHIHAWKTAAERHDYEVPALETIRFAMNLDPKEAINRLFQWTNDESRIVDVETTYRAALSAISGAYIKENGKKIETTSDDAIKVKQAPLAHISRDESKGKQPVAAEAPTKVEFLQMETDAWAAGAKVGGHKVPTAGEVEAAMVIGDPTIVVNKVFRWENVNDVKATEAIVEAYKVSRTDLVSKWMTKNKKNPVSLRESKTVKKKVDAPPLFVAQEGVISYIESLLDVKMPCAVISYLEQDQVDVLLEQTGLDKVFPPSMRVTGSDGYDRESQQMLGASLRVERRPDHIAVFDASPAASASAHDADMKSVAMIGYYKKYELLTADTTAKYLQDLSTVNLKRLFSDSKPPEALLELDLELPKPLRKVKTRNWEEGDRW